MSALRVHNLDRQSAIACTGEPSVHDFGCVVDESRTVPHPMTGKPQHPVVFSGLIPECWDFVRRQSIAKVGCGCAMCEQNVAGIRELHALSAAEKSCSCGKGPKQSDPDGHAVTCPVFSAAEKGGAK